ncbi:hypothetical protein FISHEDRAFT_58906 [Fistulina hepatica ATCC 64428]|uniref:Uncharacterized protein n=1 Tax=Fistulina hepatica ATCC 64428 TaxID=1128425 RepID=A0A0D7ABN0_9AGAR|nr:hypothetical protein FISHEDRAFT_58906 [Fistulina hepatica ATCC 64428]
MFPTSFSSFAKHRTVVPLREALEIVAPLRRSNAVMFLPYILYEAATRAELDSLWNVPDCDLSMEDKAIIFCGKLKLQNQLDETSLSFKSAVNLVYNRCSCRNYMQPTCAPYDETLLSGHTLDDRTGYINSRNSCRAHIDAFLGAHRRDRENAWRDLPAAFGLAPWDQLRAMQDVDRHAQDLPPESVPGQPSTA